jgi:hypothetical protein
MDVSNAELEFKACVLFVNSRDNQRKLPKTVKQAYTNTQIRLLEPLINLRQLIKDRRAFNVLQFAMDPGITMAIAPYQVVKDCDLTGQTSVLCAEFQFDNTTIKHVAAGTSCEFVMRIYLHAHFTERMMIPTETDELYREFVKSEQFIHSLNKYLL